MATNSKSNASAAAATQAQFVGIIPEYDGDTDDWSIYQEILEEYFKANGVPDRNKVSVLISVIGADTYRLLRDLCHPDSPKDKSYVELCAMLAKQFLPEITIFRERSKFYRAEQQRGEDVKTWYARLKNLSVNCKFGEHLEPLLLDKFIVGLVSGPVQDRLCEESEKLTLKEALDLAANRESAIQGDVIAEHMAGMHLDDLRRGRRMHGGGRHHYRGHRHHHDHDQLGGGRHGHHGRHGGHQHDGPPHHGRHGHGPHGHEMQFGFGPCGPHGSHGPHGPHGSHGSYGPHAWGGHQMGQFGPRGFRGFEGMGPCPVGMRRHDMKRWAKICRKLQGRRAQSSCSSSSSSSSSSSDSETEGEKKCKGRRHKGHEKHGHHGKFGPRREGGPGKCPRGKRYGRKEQEVDEPVVTENTEPELIE
ncbi:uncharacterized protein LOC135710514 [Ochlerotatus camptorhynchus]|uniref:uncharacterized protein LOC135710514 n=1 Tax=Ochlerotatus camptorhynchus TaxID=644619 RepID=UPI0031CE6365